MVRPIIKEEYKYGNPLWESVTGTELVHRTKPVTLLSFRLCLTPFLKGFSSFSPVRGPRVRLRENDENPFKTGGGTIIRDRSETYYSPCTTSMELTETVVRRLIICTLTLVVGDQLTSLFLGSVVPTPV